MSETIKILLADDHAVVREGLRALIDSEPEMTVIGEAADGEVAIMQARDLQPDVILMDLEMPRKSGLEAIEAIKQTQPEARILVLTSYAEDKKVFRAVKIGALGYLLKDSSPQELLRAIRQVHRGETSLHPTIARKLVQELSRPSDLPPADEQLTEREVDVLKLVAKGMSNQEIAEKLVVSEPTVRAHVSNILSKLHLANRTQAALYALREGYASLDK